MKFGEDSKKKISFDTIGKILTKLNWNYSFNTNNQNNPFPNYFQKDFDKIELLKVSLYSILSEFTPIWVAQFWMKFSQNQAMFSKFEFHEISVKWRLN